MAKKLAPYPDYILDAAGLPISGARIFTYIAGSSTKLAAYTDAGGLTALANPIEVDADGRVGGIWLDEAVEYKLLAAPAGTDDPPTSPLADLTRDNIVGVTDNSGTQSQWLATGHTPTRVNGTQFTVAGDQTATYQVGRRIQIVDSGGTKYATITASSYSSPNTTVTATVDAAGTIAAGLSSVAAGIVTPIDDSLPRFETQVTAAATDKITVRDASDNDAMKNVTAQSIADLASPSGSLIGYQTFTSTGAYTKATNSPTFVVVEVWGGGGGGGGSSVGASVAAGGGAGGFTREKLLASALSASETVTIGAAGAAGSTAGGTGGTGGTSSFGAFCSATGGAGGVGAAGIFSTAGGAGGAGSGGDINLTGAVGQRSIANVTNGYGSTGEGGSSSLGGNGYAVTNNANAPGGAAVANSGSGGGGGSAGAGAQLGGVGGTGFIIVWEYS